MSGMPLGLDCGNVEASFGMKDSHFGTRRSAHPDPAKNECCSIPANRCPCSPHKTTNNYRSLKVYMSE